MAQKEQAKTIYKTARGVAIDMGKLINTNELAVAVGNANVNARGDKLGPGGKIIQRREEIVGQAPTIPSQNNVRVQETATPAPTITPTPAKPGKKDIANMDPEGNE